MVNQLSVRNLRKSFGDELVLRDISFELQPHQVTVVIGASGSGKSTLMRCINLLEEIDDGQIILANEDITAPDINPDVVRAKIGSVFQSFNLFSHLTVLQNITLASRKVHGVKREIAEDQAMELLSRFGLEAKARSYPDLLSGGQQQRVAILRALITKPQLLLLDEVTSALDPILIAEVLTLIAELKAEGHTMLISTHEMGFALKVADELIFLQHGEIAERGNPHELLADPQSEGLRAFLAAMREAGRL